MSISAVQQSDSNRKIAMHTRNTHSFNNIFHYSLSWTPSLTHKGKAGSHGPDCLSPKPGFQHPSATKRTSERIRFCKGVDSLWGKTAETAHLSDQSPVSCKRFRKFGTMQNVSDDIGSPKSAFTAGWTWDKWFHCLLGKYTQEEEIHYQPASGPSEPFHHQAPTTRDVPYPRDAEFSTFEKHSQLQPPPGDSQCTITTLRSYKTSKSTVMANFFWGSPHLFCRGMRENLFRYIFMTMKGTNKRGLYPPPSPILDLYVGDLGLSFDLRSSSNIFALQKISWSKKWKGLWG